MLVFGLAFAVGAQAPAGLRAHAPLALGGSAPVRGFPCTTGLKIETRCAQGDGISAQGKLSHDELVREIDDPHTGERWLLVRNDLNPGGPGRMVLVGGLRNSVDGVAPRVGEQTVADVPQPVIRAGDRLIVEEHTALADAVLEARALTPAAQGSALNVRLTIGGKVVRAVALGPGRAALQPEARP